MSQVFCLSPLVTWARLSGLTRTSVQRQLWGEELRDFIGARFSWALFFQGLNAQKKSLAVTFSILRWNVFLAAVNNLCNFDFGE